MQRAGIGLVLATLSFLPVLSVQAETIGANTAEDYSSATISKGRIHARTATSVADLPLYEAGSISKFLCTIAILRLSDEGALRLDDPVGTLVPALAELPAGEVPLRHVLASRSAITDGLMAVLRQDAAAVMEIENAAEAAARFATAPLTGDPGEEWSYDLINWIIAQAVIEKSMGERLDAALARLVIRPAGMRHSRIVSGKGTVDRVTPTEPGRPLPPFLQCAGGLISTPTDLISLARFPHHGGLSAGSLAELMTVTTSQEAYTLGGRFREAAGLGVVSWQSGSNGAYKSLVVYDPSRRQGFAAMIANGDDPAIAGARDDWLAHLSE